LILFGEGVNRLSKVLEDIITILGVRATLQKVNERASVGRAEVHPSRKSGE
jgi:hypothetical protein